MSYTNEVMQDIAKAAILAGQCDPFDAPDYPDSGDAPPARTWAHTAARGIASLMRNDTRLGIEMYGWDDIERVLFVRQMELIIETAQKNERHDEP